MLVKVLGAIDLISSVVFLSLIFGAHPAAQITLFCAGLLLLKGFFVIMGNVLSLFDSISAIILICSIFFAIPSVLLWIPAFFLMAKGFVSFL